MKIDVIVERAEHNWCAYAPELADVVFATGITREETIENFRDALRGLWEFQRDEGKEVPEVTELELRETVSV